MPNSLVHYRLAPVQDLLHGLHRPRRIRVIDPAGVRLRTPQPDAE